MLHAALCHGSCGCAVSSCRCCLQKNGGCISCEKERPPLCPRLISAHRKLPCHSASCVHERTPAGEHAHAHPHQARDAAPA